ncbi:MAG TPA: KEOPS complex subunit Pcc1 [Candidatus Nanoarchaeia archaeon]|nr:KEOPS complex subunit Pcc1 [Candidatus Nanoarchaeia archaeon]
MRYRFTLEIDEDADILHKSLLPEVMQHERSLLRLEKDDKLKVIMEAKDAVALRAVVTSLLKLISTHEKIRKVKDGN